MLIALCQSTCSCSCRCSTTIMKRMKQATLFGFLVINFSLSKCLWIILCLSDWFVSHHTLASSPGSFLLSVRGRKEEMSLGTRKSLGTRLIIHFVYKNGSKSEYSHTRISIMNTAHPRGVGGSHPIHPPLNQPLRRQQPMHSLVGNGCSLWVRPKESYFPVFEFVHKFWFPNNNDKESSGHLAYWEIKQPNQRSLDGEVTECAVCKHCGCMLNTDHISYYINQVP